MQLAMAWCLVPWGLVGRAAPGRHRQLLGRLRASPLSPEPLLGQEVWKPSPKLQEKFGKISCNYPNDSCTNHTTAPQIPRRRAEPKTGRAKTHIWIQGDLWKLSLRRAWDGGGVSEGWKGCRGSGAAWAGGDHCRTASSGTDPLQGAPPGMAPRLARPPRPERSGRLNRAYRRRGDSCQLLVFLRFGKSPPFCKSKYFLGLRSRSRSSLSSPFLTEPSWAPPHTLVRTRRRTQLLSAARLSIPRPLEPSAAGNHKSARWGTERFLFLMSLSLPPSLSLSFAAP